LSSSVFDLPEYSEHMPLKKKTIDINNVADKKRKKDHMFSDIIGSSG
jgi:hypothetical protein